MHKPRNKSIRPAVTGAGQKTQTFGKSGPKITKRLAGRHTTKRS